MAGEHLPAGTILGGDFRLDSPLSSGGFGAVWVAEQQSTGAKRAVKILHRELVGDERARQRFEQEARVGVRIKSDHVVSVLAAGIDEVTGIPWIAMELLEGETLADWVANRGRASPAELSEIFTQLAHAVGAAHDEGIVHRDLKPENVFLGEARRAQAPFTVKVLDFGIAKLVAEAHARTTETIGTPLWMAPEQTTPGAPITPATDVWALGLIAFRLLSGSYYWKGAQSADVAAVAVLREVAFEPLARASERTQATLPDGFDDWFTRCVARDPKERFQDARSAIDALRPILAAASPEQAVIRPISATARARIASAPTAPLVELAVARTAPAPTPPLAKASERARGSPFLTAVTIVALAALGVFAWRWRQKSSAPEPSTNGSAASVVVSASIAPSVSFSASASASAVGSAVLVVQPPPAVKSCPDGMRKIPGGTYKLGHGTQPITIGTYCISPTEVTIEEYAGCAESKLCPPGEATVKSPRLVGTEVEKWSKLCNFGKADRAGHPMNCVDWAAAGAFCKAHGGRLPLEEEWEWAARGGEEARLYPWGNEDPPVPGKKLMCWAKETGKLGTCPVLAFPAGVGRWELADMAGNVREWTLNAQEDEPEKRVFRGGCFGVTSPTEARVDAWDAMLPENRLHNVGFRCAVTFTR